MTRLSNIMASLKAHPGYTLMRGVARFAAIRRLVAGSRSALHGNRVNAYLADCEARFSQSTFAGIDRVSFVQKLRDDGVAFGLRLPAATVETIQRLAQQTQCYADRVAAHGFHVQNREAAETALGKPILLAQYFNVTEQCPEIRKLAQDPVLQWIACQYLKSVPTFVGANLWWTFPVKASEEERSRHAHLFHRDVDDFRFFKFFFYLTDVSAGEGAHVCVAASHRAPPQIRPGDRWNIRRYSDQEIQDSYPERDILEICGPAGTGFAEDTLCIHKGQTPLSDARLLLQLQFALFDHGVMHDRRSAAELGMVA